MTDRWGARPSDKEILSPLEKYYNPDLAQLIDVWFNPKLLREGVMSTASRITANVYSDLLSVYEELSDNRPEDLIGRAQGVVGDVIKDIHISGLSGLAAIAACKGHVERTRVLSTGLDSVDVARNVAVAHLVKAVSLGEHIPSGIRVPRSVEGQDAYLTGLTLVSQLISGRIPTVQV